MENRKEFPQKTKAELPYDPAIPLLDIYMEKTIIWKDTCTPIFIAAVFTIAKTWKQPKCPLTDEWIKMWFMHAKSLQSCPTLCDPMDCSPPSSSVHGTLQARTLEWGAMPSSRGSSPPRDQAHVSCFSCIGSQVLYHYRHLVSTKKMWHMYTMKYYAIIKRNKIRSFAATYIQLLIIILSEIKSEKHKLYCFHLYVESKLWHKWTYIQNRKRLIDIEIRLVFAKAEEKQRDRLGIWDW